MSWFDRLFIRPHPRPIFVLGNQRSGTSAIAHLLADACGLTKTVDIPQLWWPGLAPLLAGRTTIERIVARHPRPFASGLIKEPNLTFFFEDLRRLFPAASFVFVLRDPRDNVRSQLDRMGLPGDLRGLDPVHWSIPATWAHLFDRDAWNLRGDSPIDLLAGRWNRAADVYLDHRDDFALARYEDFDADKVAAIADLAHRVGRAVVRDIADRADVQYQPPGRRSVPWLELFGERNLRRLEDLCLERMERLGYEVSLCPI